MSFLKSKGFKYLKNLIIGVGAAIVLMGALFKIESSTGGGAILREPNRIALRNRGTVIYLRASADDLWRRTRNDKNRPLLQTDNPRARLQELLSQRDPLYREIAHVIADTGEQNVQKLVRHLEQELAQL